MSFFSIGFVILMSVTVLMLGVVNSRTLVRRIGQRAAGTVSDWLLIIFSLVFIGAVDIKAVLIVLGIASVIHLAVCRRIRERFGVKAKIAGVLLAIGVLLLFKYFDFFIDSVCLCFGLDDPGTLVLYVPLGVSYFSFSIISYVCDIYDQKIEEDTSFTQTLLYIVFFPKFVSGPIVKAADFIAQTKSNEKRVTLAGIERGVQMLLLGMFKKAVVADRLGGFVNDVFNAPAAYDSFTIWLAVISYTLQLYFDFSGYSDMAIGCAAMLGYEFKRNFDMPFAASSIQDFWRRWHISLSTWFRDYLYIPLGGNRKGKLRTGLNKTIVFFCTGLWHGASWTFVCWGMIHGAFMLLETYKLIQPSKWRLKPLKYIYTMAVVSIAFMIFRADSMTTVMEMLKGMFMLRGGVFQPYTWAIAAIIILAAAMVVTWKKNKEPINGSRMRGYYPCLDLSRFGNLLIVWLVVFSIIVFSYMGASGFIYAQF